MYTVKDVATKVAHSIRNHEQFLTKMVDFDFKPKRRHEWFGVKRLQVFGEQEMSLYTNKYGGGFVPEYRFVDDINDALMVKSTAEMQGDLRDAIEDMMCSVAGITPTDLVDVRFVSHELYT